MKPEIEKNQSIGQRCCVNPEVSAIKTHTNLQASEVVKFYKNKNILITGATGFLGKVLLWKLIETCEDTGTIYVLVRAKNNVSPEKRLIQLLKSKPFSYRHDYVELLKRVVAIESDMTADGLGLSQTDRTLLQERVNVVFHSAASVKFDASLKENLRDNFYGTRSIVELCKAIDHLDAFVHVSTAYSNCQLPEIAEDVIPLRKDVDDLVTTIETLPRETCESITEQLLEGRPNTYTYTKAMAEQVVGRNEGKFPISIVRPSIVVSSAHEPWPGWVDNVNGIAGLGSLAAIGLLRTIDWNYDAVSDLVPVDYVTNCIICAARQVSVNSPKKMLIYNMTSGNMTPISWGRVFELLRDNAVKTPPTKIVRPIIAPPKYKRVNKINFFLTRFLSEILFAYLIDFLLVLLGYKKVVHKITKKMHNGYKILRPFTTRQWNFHSDNVTKLNETLNPVDRELFKFDMRHFDWHAQASGIWAGARVMILKEEPSERSIRTGLMRQKIVTIVHYGLIAIMLSTMLYLSYSTTRLVRSLVI